jgi:tetratricopeptide (TPR) repeat protein
MNRRASYYIIFGIFVASMLAVIFGTFVWPKGKAVLYLMMSRKMLDNGKIDTAIEQAREAARIMPESSIIVHNLVEIYTEADMYEEAEKAVEDLIELSPESARAYVDLGVLRLKRGDLEGAKEAAEKAQSISPDLDYNYYLFGIIAWDENDLDTARVNLKKAVEMNPRSYVFLYRLGALYRMQGELDQAIEELKKATELRPDYIAAHDELAMCYLEKGFLVHALAELKLVVNLDPSDSRSMYNIACVYSLRNNTESALRWLERSIDNGYKDFEFMNDDPDLDNIRNSPKYIELIKGAASDVSHGADTSGSEKEAAPE